MYRTKAIYQLSDLKQSSLKILRLFKIYRQSGSQAPVTTLGGGHRYSWILLDTVFFGYLANFWDPSIQVSKKNMFLRQTS